MPNSDTTYGTYNKRTHIYIQTRLDDSELSANAFTSVAEAKNHFLPAELQTIFDECCTNLQWALAADENGTNNRLKVTFDFGIKGGVAEDWAKEFNTRKSSVGAPTIPASVMFSQTEITDPDSPEHLF